MYQLDAYSKAILAAVAKRLSPGSAVTDADILPDLQATYPDMTIEGLRPRLTELGENWLEVEGSGNDETVTVTGTKRDWDPDALAGDVAEGEKDPGRE